MLIRRQLEYRGVELMVILQPDSSLACIPAWMTHEAAAQYALSEKPRFSVDILRSLRAAADATLAQETDSSAPVPDGPWEYYTRTVEGQQENTAADNDGEHSAEESEDD